MASLGDMAKIKNISTRGDISPSEEKFLKLEKEKNCFGICSSSRYVVCYGDVFWGV